MVARFVWALPIQFLSQYIFFVVLFMDADSVKGFIQNPQQAVSSTLIDSAIILGEDTEAIYSSMCGQR